MSEVEFTFFRYLNDYYRQNRGKIRSHYKGLTKRILDYNDPTNADTWLRTPQYEALEIYIFLKEYLDNRHLSEIFLDWRQKQGRFADRAEIALFEELDASTFDAVFASLQNVKQEYANYIFALTMGVGKTLLMATCIFYEFLLARKFEKDRRFCHNALIFAPDKTVLQSLREIEMFDKTRVLPPEYANQLDSMIRFHFLDDSGLTLNTLDGDRFNLIISNTQKIILKRRQKEPNAISQLFMGGSFEDVVAADPTFAELVELAELSDENLTSNQRFKKLARLPQLGIYVDEAHHAFGAKLDKDLYDRKTQTSLRLTIDMLAQHLERQGTHVVACYNFTGTPYANNKLLPEVVYSYALKQAIQAEYLKTVTVTGLQNAKSDESISLAVKEFWDKYGAHRYEGMLPKIAFFAATIDELTRELRPAVEKALAKIDVSLDKILVNVGDEKLTSNDDIREFINLDTPTSEKQFILLVNKGKEGWNCRSLFAVSMFRKPKSAIFVLQATMRCLRSITSVQQEGSVYLSEENVQILEKELQENFRMTIDEFTSGGTIKKKVWVKPTEPPITIRLKRTRKMYELKEKQSQKAELDLASIDRDKYRIMRTTRDLSDLKKKTKVDEDITAIQANRDYSEITLVAEIARYLNKPALSIQRMLSAAETPITDVVSIVSAHNEILYDWIIPRLFHQLYQINEFTRDEESEVTLVNPPPDENGFLFSVLPELLATTAEEQYSRYLTKSFHLDHYCFDSKPEFAFFLRSLDMDTVEKIYFTGMLTHGQSDFLISYIDPESHTLRRYFPDFLIKKTDGTYVIVEIKGDNKLDDPIVLAKQEYATNLAITNHMHYQVIAGSDALARNWALS